LRRLEQKYKDELVVIGIEAGKFTAERVTTNIRQAVLRLGIEHPVINDRYFRIWRSFGVNAWPTLVLIDPLGHYVDSHPGEITFEDFDPIIGRLVQTFEARGLINRAPLSFRPERSNEPERPLAFPAKVLADENQRLFIADTSHHRVLIVALEGDRTTGSVQAIVGKGEPGMIDGGLSSAQFNRPHGLTIEGNTLYVADTENHAIRAIDLDRREVKTIAGTGSQGRRITCRGQAARASLNSPWAVLARSGTLYVAMAGLHQLYTIDLSVGEIAPFAGNGLEDLSDGPMRDASLAQPSGLTTDGVSLYFADSESSAIRRASLCPDGHITTIVGTGLFDFGDRDGVGDEVRLQHPMGVAWHAGRLFVADTYNNKIKLIDPVVRRATTFLGTGAPGMRNGDQSLFYEPAGLTVAGDVLYIADTNNHNIRVVELRTRQTSTLRLRW